MYQGDLKLCANAVCPFYRSEFKKTITCEGVVDGGTFMQKFPNEEAKTKYAKANCLNYPNECCIAKALDKKYQ